MPDFNLRQDDRRTSVRRVPLAVESLSRVRLRAGDELQVINVSDTGMLVEGDLRLLPGGSVDVHVTGRSGCEVVRGSIARAYVSALKPDGVRYRAAVAFERRLDTGSPEYAVLTTARGDVLVAGSGYPPVERSGIVRAPEGLPAQGVDGPD